MKPRREMTAEEHRRYKQLLTCRTWLARRRFDEAYLYARKRGFTLDDAYASCERSYVPYPPKGWTPPDQIPALVPVDFTRGVDQVPPSPVISDVKPASVQESALTTPEPERPTAPVTWGAIPVLSPDLQRMEINGWPVETDAMIWNTCRNKRLLVIQLPDGRQAAVYRDVRRNWRIGTTIKVKLEEASGDPLYSYAPV